MGEGLCGDAVGVVGEALEGAGTGPARGRRREGAGAALGWGDVQACAREGASRGALACTTA